MEIGSIKNQVLGWMVISDCLNGFMTKKLKKNVSIHQAFNEIMEFVKSINFMINKGKTSLSLVLLTGFIFFGMVWTVIGQPNSDEIIFPRGFGIAVNQVGYMDGSNMGDIEETSEGPWRAGIRRKFDVRDYRPFVEVGEEVGVRFVTLFALAEMDRLNIVAEYPTATMWGSDFDNSKNIGPTQLEIMDYVKENAAHIELGVTGVGHEYWIEGKKHRSEWYNVYEQYAWPESEMRGRMDLIGKILAQYGISEVNGHSFPESMSAYGYHWNPNGDVSTGKIWSDYGVKYGNTKFILSPEIGFPESGTGGFDHGVLLFDRLDYGPVWHRYADVPELPVDHYVSDLTESHWANWLAEDDWLQPDLNQEWIEYLRTIQAHPNHYLAKNNEQLYSQWLYKRHTTVTETNSGIISIDNRNMAEEAYAYDMLGNMVLAVALEEGEHVSNATLSGNAISAYFEEAGFGYIYLPRLEKDVYEFTYEVGSTQMDRFVNNTGTYNVYNVVNTQNKFSFFLKMYGTQTVHVKTEKPNAAESDNENLRILSQVYDADNGVLSLEINGRNIQGEQGSITLKY
jgi:hypothetical protein